MKSLVYCWPKHHRSALHKSNREDNNAVQINHLLMWLHHSTLRRLVDFRVVSVISCNILLRPVLHENVTCMQEKLFSWVVIWRSWYERGIMQFPHRGRPHRGHTEDEVCVRVCGRDLQQRGTGQPPLTRVIITLWPPIEGGKERQVMGTLKTV